MFSNPRNFAQVSFTEAIDPLGWRCVHDYAFQADRIADALHLLPTLELTERYTVIRHLIRNDYWSHADIIWKSITNTNDRAAVLELACDDKSVVRDINARHKARDHWSARSFVAAVHAAKLESQARKRAEDARKRKQKLELIRQERLAREAAQAELLAAQGRELAQLRQEVAEAREKLEAPPVIDWFAPIPGLRYDESEDESSSM